MDFINFNSINSFWLEPIYPVEIESLILNLKNSKQDINSLSVSILKENSSFVSTILCDLFNYCFQKGLFPDSLKVATIIPIHKKGHNSIISNYRPISLLPIFSKILEKCIKSRLLKYMNSKNIIHPAQFGFQSNKSTQDAILHVIENIYENLNGRSSTLSAFVDFAIV